MRKRDILQARKAIDQVSADLERRKRERQEYRPRSSQPAQPVVVQASEPVRYVVEVPPPKTGFSKKQTCFFVFLTIILTTVCLCGGLFSLPFIIGDPPEPLFQPATPVIVSNNIPAPTSRPNNQTRAGLVIAGIKLSPFVSESFAQPGPGNWWRVDVTFYNASNKPVTVSGYDIVLRDFQGREFWYDRNLSFFGTQDNLVPQINPGVSTTVPVVFNLPEQLAGLTVHYNGAMVLINPEDIAR